jgi:hypothetical protein
MRSFQSAKIREHSMSFDLAVSSVATSPSGRAAWWDVGQRVSFAAGPPRERRNSNGEHLGGQSTET